MTARLADDGMTVVASTPEQFTAFLARETEKFTRVIEAAGIKIPVPPKILHRIETDDPIGVEAYWHRRFDDKRGEGEWFDLSPEDIRAFKRWKRIA